MSQQFPTLSACWNHSGNSQIHGCPRPTSLGCNRVGLGDGQGFGVCKKSSGDWNMQIGLETAVLTLRGTSLFSLTVAMLSLW